MSTSDRAAMIDRKTAGAACRALELMRKEWRLPPEAWEEITELLDDLSAAVTAGNAAAVDALTGELEELSGSRVTPITGERDGRVPLPEQERERVVALVHLLDPDSAPDEPRPVPSERP
ncbi:CATRA system-associated protein [Streptomyces pseudogriseolus]|uniref:CATRA system-associated protein n=1 Tax=Streptomyces TaxID=1883 RepID=UPI00131D72DE|nr:CATRA system-associated protein [Streptomyces sp. NRRL F-5527]